MGFVLALIALVIAVIDAATHGFSLIVLAVILVSLAILVEGYSIIGNLTRR